ncbi:MAG: uroporphyrinogen-III synthase [Chitinophagaceae bacterium]|nr:uroporphyrinogen-III synthase [Chitinophagaceae bacterium]
MAKVVAAPKKKAVKKAPAKVASPTKTKVETAPKKSTVKVNEPLKEVHSVLVTLPKPETEKSPYFEIAKKYNVLIEFFAFVKLEGIDGRDFKKQKVDIAAHSAIIFTSRNAVEHFFRICDEIKLKISQDMKYFCTSEAIALYLQKYILYRKRKVFFSADGTTDGLLEVIAKHKHKEHYILPTADNGKSEIQLFLEKNKISFSEATLYSTVSNDIKVLMKKKYDLLLFFSSLSIQTLFDYFPKFNQGDTIIASFGTPTAKAILDANLRLDMAAPSPGAPSMAAALDMFLEVNKKGRKK